MRLRMMRSIARALSALVATDTWNPALRRTASRTLSCTGLSSTSRTWFKNPSPAPLPGALLPKTQSHKDGVHNQILRKTSSDMHQPDTRDQNVTQPRSAAKEGTSRVARRYLRTQVVTG